MERVSVKVKTTETKYIPDVTLIDITEPVSAKWRVNQRVASGVDGYLFDDYEGFDGYEGKLIFECLSEKGYRTLLQHVYPSYYGEIGIDYEAPNVRIGAINYFEVEELGYGIDGMMRIVTFNVLYQPFVYRPVQTIQLNNSTTFVTNTGAQTDQFEILFDSTQETNIYIKNKAVGYNESMTIAGSGRNKLDNGKKRIVANGVISNGKRKSGYYFKLYTGENEISFFPRVTNASIVLRWRDYA